MFKTVINVFKKKKEVFCQGHEQRVKRTAKWSHVFNFKVMQEMLTQEKIKWCNKTVLYSDTEGQEHQIKCLSLTKEDWMAL